MEGKTRAGVALVPGPSGRGPSARRARRRRRRRRRRPGLLLPGLWLLLLAGPASCAPGKPRRDPPARPCLPLLLLFSESSFPLPSSFILHRSLALLS